MMLGKLNQQIMEIGIDHYVTCITSTGSVMVNWSKGFLIQGVTTVIVVSIHALGLV